MAKLKYSLYFMRHLKTDYNLEGRVIGNLDIPISMRIKHFVDVSEVENNDPMIILSSPLRRCRESIEYLKKIVNIKDIIFIEELIERNLGILQGQLKTELTDLTTIINGKINLFSSPAKGESYEDFLKRSLIAANLIRDMLKSSNVLVVSHLHILKILTINMGINKTIQDWNSFTFEHGSVKRICYV